MNNFLLVTLSGLLIITGTLGSVLPFLPGLPVALLGLVIFAWFSQAVSIWGLVVFGILTLLTIVVDVFAPAIVARGRKASRKGVIGAIVGGILGIFIFPPIGILLGPFLGAFIGEIMNSSTTEHAVRIGLASLMGLVVGSLFKLVVGMSMFIYFIVASIRYLAN